MATVVYSSDTTITGDLTIGAGDFVELDCNANDVTLTFSKTGSQPQITGTGTLRPKNNGTNKGTIQGNSTYNVDIATGLTVDYDFGGAGSYFAYDLVKDYGTRVTGGGGVTFYIDGDVQLSNFTYSAGDTFRVDCVTNAAAIEVEWEDTASCGFAASAGALELVGNGTYGGTIVSASGTSPTNYWDFRTSSSDITADYFTFEGFGAFSLQDAGCNIDIDYCTFEYNNPSFVYAIRFDGGLGSALNSFTNNTLDNLGGTGAVFRCGIDHYSFDNIIITNVVDGPDVRAWTNAELHFANSNFNLENCAVGPGDSLITSEEHNDVAGYYGIVLRSADTVTMTNVPAAKRPGAANNVYLFLEVGATESTFHFDVAAITIESLHINIGEKITVQDSQTLTITGDMENLYILNVTAGKLSTVDTTNGGDVTFQDRAGIAVNISAGAEWEITGAPAVATDLQDYDTTKFFDIYVTGKDKEADFDRTIDLYNLGTLDLDRARFYHVKDPARAFVTTMTLDDAEMWFTVPLGVYTHFQATSYPSVNFARIVSYDAVEYTFGQPPAVQHHGYYENSRPIIMGATFLHLIFHQAPQHIEEVLPSLIEDDASYEGGENVPIERTHDSRTLIKIRGDIVYQADDDWNHPIRQKMFIQGQKNTYLNEDAAFDFIWAEGALVDCQIDELKFFPYAGHQHHYQRYGYKMIIKGDVILAD